MTIFSNTTRIPPLVFLTFHLLLLLLLLNHLLQVEAKCKAGCHLALASYYVWEGSNLTYISTIFGKQISEILQYNPQVPNQDRILSGTRINVPFSCDCLNGDFLGHTFTYQTVFGDTYDRVVSFSFANLTTEDWMQRVNTFEPTRIPAGALINVTVNCSCGDRSVSKDYGLFTTYPLHPGENLSSIAAAEPGVPIKLLQRYNPGVDFNAETGLVFLPARG